MGEPVAAVAAVHPETARRAAAAIIVDYAPTEPLTDPVAAADAEPIHPLATCSTVRGSAQAIPTPPEQSWSRVAMNRYAGPAQMGPSPARDPG